MQARIYSSRGADLLLEGEVASAPIRDTRLMALTTPATIADAPAVPRGSVRRGARLAVVLAASVILGGATSLAQLLLPALLAPLGNSAGAWTLLAVLLLVALGERTAVSAFAGAGAFVGLVLGYQVVSGLRGFPTSEELFLIAGVVVGPFVGVAASWLRSHGVRAALGAGLLAGIWLGEGIYGLTVVAATTSPVVWMVEVAGALVLLGVVTTRALTRGLDRGIAIGLAVATSTAFLGAYSALL